MSHNHEPGRAASRHKPAIIAIIVALAVAIIAFMVFTPGANEESDGIATTAPPAGTPITDAAGTEIGAGEPVVPEDANTPASGSSAPAGAADPPAGAELESPGAPETPLADPASSN